ncbi:MAG: hypothetical protein EXR62_04295 [Chloroflexi bacterium]|nr:hypothetical protein [Chloroflexota bacterium]
MQPCTLRIEPAVKNTHTPHPATSGSDLEIVQVFLFAQGYEYQHGGQIWGLPRYWFMYLPEQIYVNHESWRFQFGMDWQEQDGHWSYTGAPIRNLLGLWRYVDGRAKLDFAEAKKRPTIGAQSAEIWADDTGLHYSIGVKNTTAEVWHDVYQWICLDSFLSPETGFRPHFRTSAGWIAYQDIPNIDQHRYFPPPGMESEYARTLGKRCTPLEFAIDIPAVVAWNIVDEGPLLTCHYSRQAVGVGANQMTPCTDVFLWYGDIAPGEEKTRWGHVWIGPSTLVDFDATLQDLLPLWHQRES